MLDFKAGKIFGWAELWHSSSEDKYLLLQNVKQSLKITEIIFRYANTFNIWQNEKFMETHSVYEPISEEKKLLRTMIEKKEPGLVSKFLERIENRNCLKVLQEKDEDDNPSLFEACCKT